MSTVASCVICGSARMYYAFSVQSYRLLGCQDCGYLMLNPQPSDQDLTAIYGEDYALLSRTEAGRKQFSELKRATARHYLDTLKQYRGADGGRLLEFGCGKGDLLAVASLRGYEVTGVEISPYACEEARRSLNGSGEIIHGDLGAVLDRKNQYDVCILADCIEHVRDPRGLLEGVHSLLKPDGVIFVATPSLGSWSARLLKDKWMEFKAEHLHYFDQNTLHSLLFQCGFHRIVPLKGYKVLSLDYILDHFKRFPVPRLSFALGMCRALPERWRTRPISVVASGMVAIATKTVVPQRRKVSIVLPAYNEAKTIPVVLDKLVDRPIAGVDKEIVLVESNSSDGTREIALRYRNHPQVKLVLEDRPRGKGHAVRTGLAYATGDFVLIQDADLEYDLEDYEVLLEPLLSGRRAFVLGSRHGGSTWKMRHFKGKPFLTAFFYFGHWSFKTLVNVCCGIRLADPFTMYKVFRRDCISGLKLECNRFDFDNELLVKLVRKGYRPVEIPVNYRSRTFREGKKISVLRDPWTWVRAIVGYRFLPWESIQTMHWEGPAPGTAPAAGMPAAAAESVSIGRGE